jgi:alkaline phosphatase D
MAQVRRKVNGVITYGMDNWDGYAATRARLFKSIHQNNIKNVVVLTGDSHKNWVNDLHLDADDINSPIIATEFMGTSISSAGDGSEDSPAGKELMNLNSHIKFYNEQRGYVFFTITPTEMLSEFKVVPFVSRPNAPMKTIARFLVKNGISGVEQVVDLS